MPEEPRPLHEPPETSESADAQPVPTETAEPEYASTPFDGPYFIPILLLGMCLWFGYDGWFNPDRLDPEASISKYVAFNQYGALILGLLGGILGVRAWRRQQAERSAD